MTCIHPYMLRRADCYYFRIQVPADLRLIFSQREFTRSLKTGVFPNPVPLGPRAVGWLESDVSAWIANRVKIARDAGRQLA